MGAVSKREDPSAQVGRNVAVDLTSGRNSMSVLVLATAADTHPLDRAATPSGCVPDRSSDIFHRAVPPTWRSVSLENAKTGGHGAADGARTHMPHDGDRGPSREVYVLGGRLRHD